MEPRRRRRRESPPAAPAADMADRVVASLATVMHAPRETLRLPLLCLLAEGHVLVEDVPGVGKTVLAKALARTLDLRFSRLQFTPDLLPSDVTGRQRLRPAGGRLPASGPGPVFANVLLVDEVNRASPKTQSALLEAMQETQVTVDGETYPLERPFLAIATQNPVEYEGTYPLPEAQLDRFAVKMSIGYPPLAEEARMLVGADGRAAARRPRAGRRARRASSRRSRAAARRLRRGERQPLRRGAAAPHARRAATSRSAPARARGSRCCGSRRRGRSWSGATSSRPRTSGSWPSPSSLTGSSSRRRRGRPASGPATSFARRSTRRPCRCETEELLGDRSRARRPRSPRGCSARRPLAVIGIGLALAGARSRASGRGVARDAVDARAHGCCPESASRAVTPSSRCTCTTGADCSAARSSCGSASAPIEREAAAGRLARRDHLRRAPARPPPRSGRSRPSSMTRSGSSGSSTGSTRRSTCSSGHACPCSRRSSRPRARGTSSAARSAIRRPTRVRDPRRARYAPGEPLRAVHWPSTARRGRLMVKELDDAPREDLALVLDQDAAGSPGRPGARASTPPYAPSAPSRSRTSAGTGGSRSSAPRPASRPCVSDSTGHDWEAVARRARRGRADSGAASLELVLRPPVGARLAGPRDRRRHRAGRSAPSTRCSSCGAGDGPCRSWSSRSETFAGRPREHARPAVLRAAAAGVPVAVVTADGTIEAALSGHLVGARRCLTAAGRLLARRRCRWPRWRSRGRRSSARRRRCSSPRWPRWRWSPPCRRGCRTGCSLPAGSSSRSRSSPLGRTVQHGRRTPSHRGLTRRVTTIAPPFPAQAHPELHALVLLRRARLLRRRRGHRRQPTVRRSGAHGGGHRLAGDGDDGAEHRRDGRPRAARGALAAASSRGVPQRRALGPGLWRSAGSSPLPSSSSARAPGRRPQRSPGRAGTSSASRGPEKTVQLVWSSDYSGIEFPSTPTTVLKVTAPRRALYWRASTLDLFASDRWIEALYTHRGRGRPPPAAVRTTCCRPQRARRAGWVRQEVDVRALVDNHVVGAAQPMRSTPGPAQRLQSQSGGVMRAPAGLSGMRRYTVWSYAPRPTPGGARAVATGLPASRSSATSTSGGRWRPRSAYPERAALGRRALPGRSRYQPMWAYRRCLARGAAPHGRGRPRRTRPRWRSSAGCAPTAASATTSARRLPEACRRSSTSWQRSKLGYCQHFAGSMALMLRYLGIPARVAVGFTSGTWKNGVWTVTDHDAHAWVEAWFAGYGWLTFDPTPGRGRLAGTYTYASDSADAVRALGTVGSATGGGRRVAGPATPDAGRGPAHDARASVALPVPLAAVLRRAARALPLAKERPPPPACRAPPTRAGAPPPRGPSSPTSSATRARALDATRAGRRARGGAAAARRRLATRSRPRSPVRATGRPRARSRRGRRDSGGSCGASLALLRDRLGPGQAGPRASCGVRSPARRLTAQAR